MAKQTKQQGPVSKKGIVTDTSYLNQPLGALTFALNTVNESETGDDGWRSNEQSNEACFTLPDGFVPIGQIYIDKNQTLIFSTSEDEQFNEIGITDINCKYTTLVRAFLGFQIKNQISGTYRLRRGCERTVYFTTPIPMIFNLDKPDDFKTNGQWDLDKFKLFKIYEQIPNFDSVEIIENGALQPGSYNAAIQYLDDDLNPTEWITSCEPIKIYNDSTSKDYLDIRGSTTILDGITNFGTTNKSIKFSFSNFDSSYPFYRVAIIEGNTGNGLVSAVNFSAPISTNIRSFTYSGISSIVTVGTEEEIIAFNNIIAEAEFVEQIENRLILGKTKGQQINFCNLQKYASSIQANLDFKEINLNIIGDSNPKTESVNFNGTGYMPGEIYSFGIVYIFEDSSLSPVYHIPGRANGYSSLMSDDNKNEDILYQDNSCKDYWGLDSQGVPLINTPLRHHRFPSRGSLNEPLYTQIKDAEPFELNYLELDISGTNISSAVTISYMIEYTIDGTPNEYTNNFLSANYVDADGLQRTITTSRGEILVTAIYEDLDGGGFTQLPGNGLSPDTGLTYDTSIVLRELDSEVSFFTSNIFGITFSGISTPSKEDTNGQGVIGYYIVRNERTEDEKTILDSGVIVPMMEDKRSFVAHGHIFPNLDDTTKIDHDIFALIHPEHKFNGREYRNLTSIKQEGEYVIVKQSYSSVLTQDVGAGTSYDPDVHKKSGKDGDGFTLHTLTRDTEVFLEPKIQDWLTPFEPNQGEIFYLNTLNSKVVKDSEDNRQEVYNVSGDNKIGVITMTEDIPNPNDIFKKLPYVILHRKLANPYGNFRVLPYFKENRNPIYFDEKDTDPVTNGQNAYVFNGDSYITPMRYHSAMYYDFRIKDRPEKKGTWKIILGAIIAVIGIVASVFTLGSSLALTAVGVGLLGASVAAAGFGISQIAAGVEANQIAKVYQELYEAGIRETISDNDTATVFNRTQLDDEFQWLGDVVTNLWFESGVNMGLRNGVSIAITDFLNAPANRADDFGLPSHRNSDSDAPNHPLDQYLLEKLTTIDTDNSDGRLYRGYSGAELYFLSKDYLRTNKQKVFFALGLEYDCCSECIEDFPQRAVWSEQSFQEELTDNYRVFLPNNYRDIEGEKGVMTDIFRMKNNLYIHTEGALWHLPQNIQERVTGDIVSFIGTGSFFSIPPRKIVDTDIESAGTVHNWGRLKTEHGTLFISEAEGKVFLFDGERLNPLSTRGNDNWFKRNLPIQSDIDYLISAGVPNPLRNNPSNPFGTGFISTYDTHKERFIITKKDYVLSSRITDGDDFRSCILDGDYIIFDGFQQTIDDRADDDWAYEGFEYCKMRFSKVIITQEEQIREVIGVIPSNAHIHYFLDTSGSFGTEAGDCLQSIQNAIEAWHASLNNPNIKLFRHVDATEQWVNYAQAVSATVEYVGENLGNLDIIVVSFCNEAAGSQGAGPYHGNDLQSTISDPTNVYLDDYDKFTGNNLNGNNPTNSSVFNLYNSFFGIHYPIVFGTDSSNCNGGTNANGISASKEFVSQSIAALEGETLTLGEASAILTPQNLGFTIPEWATLSTALQGVNNYPTGLKNFNWFGKWNRHSITGQPVIDEATFAQDIDELIRDNTTVGEEVILVDVATTVIEYEEGVIVDEPFEFDNSWTMSFSLKDNEWVSWHSYIPNMYIYRLQEFFSWRAGNNSFWKHNRDNHYQTFYGVLYPHIIEYVDNNSPEETKVWDYVQLQTKAEQFSSTYNDYVNVDVTFNKMIAYTSKQATGLLNIVVKQDGENYLDNQVINNLDSILIDRNEEDWTLNDLRDIRTNYALPLFRKDKVSLQSEYYIDKILNQDALNFNKDWNDLQSFRDKYLVLRLIFDNFDDIRLVTNFTRENGNKSFR